MTIPQIEAVLSRLDKHVSLKIGIPMKETDVEVPEEEHTVDDGMKFAALFNGLQ